MSCTAHHFKETVESYKLNGFFVAKGLKYYEVLTTFSRKREGIHMNFTFETNERSHNFCLLIVEKMITSFGISQVEALGRVNGAWSRDPFVEALDLRYHEDTEYWAYELYYGTHSEWWNREGDPTLRPLPYP